MKYLIFVCLLSSFLFACGGGGSSDTKTPPTTPPTTNPPPAELSLVVLSAITPNAVEISNQPAKFRIERTRASTALNIAFEVVSVAATGETLANNEDYRLVYAEGDAVGASFALPANQNSRIIEVQAIQDDKHEVPEVLEIRLLNASAYELGAANSAQVSIVDATNDEANTKVFIGIFGPQGNAVTTASGSLSVLLNGENSQAILSYEFSGLSSMQTDQHIHLAPSGTVIKDIELSGPVSTYVLDLQPGGPFTTRQQLLDALFAGELYLNIHTSNYSSGEISAAFIFNENVEPPSESELTAAEVDHDIIRFLSQATFGPTEADYIALRALINEDGSNRLQIYNQWIETQFNVPQTSLLRLTDESVAAFTSEQPWYERRDAFWPIAVYGHDQLRQRVAFALSEILVIGDDVNVIRRAYRGTADYWDKLAENAFGTYRKALEDATRHAVMGFWLSHLRNKKADLEAGSFPDENYAREVMQLFSFGLIQKQQNGAIKLGSNNLPLPTYNNDVIHQMARVFTGLAMSALDIDGELVTNTNFDLNNATRSNLQYRWTEPMKFFPRYHEYGEKQLFTDNGNTLMIAASAEQTIAVADAELARVLDAITAHSSTAPSIARILIQRLVTSNPSGNYIETVANAFGNEGDMKAVVKAILLDPEARNPQAAESEKYGKVKEQVLQFTSLFRLLEGKSEVALGAGDNGLALPMANQFPQNATIMRIGEQSFSQRVLGSPSVFNFFSPDFSPTGKLSQNGLVAPEMQLVNESQLFAHMNLVNKLLSNGLVRFRTEQTVSFTRDQLTVRVSENKLESIWQATTGTNEDKATAVVDFLDTYLNAGYGQRYQTNNRDILIQAISTATSTERYKLAIYGSINSPEFAVQK